MFWSFLFPNVESSWKSRCWVAYPNPPTHPWQLINKASGRCVDISQRIDRRAARARKCFAVFRAPLHFCTHWVPIKQHSRTVARKSSTGGLTLQNWQNSTNLQCFIFQFVGSLEHCLGRLSPQNPPVATGLQHSWGQSFCCTRILASPLPASQPVQINELWCCTRTTISTLRIGRVLQSSVAVPAQLDTL